MPYRTPIIPSVWARNMFLGRRLKTGWLALQQALKGPSAVQGCGIALLYAASMSHKFRCRLYEHLTGQGCEFEAYLRGVNALHREIVVASIQTSREASSHNHSRRLIA
jgi:hypothetical protein